MFGRSSARYIEPVPMTKWVLMQCGRYLLYQTLMTWCFVPAIRPRLHNKGCVNDKPLRIMRLTVTVASFCLERFQLCQPPIARTALALRRRNGNLNVYSPKTEASYDEKPMPLLIMSPEHNLS